MTAASGAPEVLHVWGLYLRASEEAHRRGDRRTGTEHLVLAVLGDPAVEVAMGVSLGRAREALQTLDHDVLRALGMASREDAPPLPTRAVPTKPTLRAVMTRDHLRMTPAAKKVLEEAVRPNRRKLQVTAPQVLARILTLRPPDPAAALLEALDVDVAGLRGRLDVTAPGG